MFSHQNCLRAGRVAGQGVCRVGGRKEERRSGGSWGDGRVPCQVALGRKKRRLRQSASAFPPANIASLCQLSHSPILPFNFAYPPLKILEYTSLAKFRVNFL